LTLQLTVLDLFRSPRETFALAVESDRLGYARYWITEHQPQVGPLTVLPLLAARTKRIRVGTAGILTRYYAPPRTALDFRFLEALYPGRIDAGLCGGGIPPELEADFHAAQGDESQARQVYLEKARLIAEYIRGERPDAVRRVERPPQLWIHGSGPNGAQLAAQLSASFSYGLFLRGNMDSPEAVELYRERFVQRPEAGAPRALIAVAGVCAATDAAAQEIVERHSNSFIIPGVVGSPERCVAELTSLAERYGTTEVALMDVCSLLDERLACYRLIAERLEIGA